MLSCSRSFLGMSTILSESVWTAWITEVLRITSTSEAIFRSSLIFSSDVSSRLFLNSSFIFCLAASRALVSFLKTSCLVLCNNLKSFKTLIAVYSFLTRGEGGTGTNLFSLLPSDRTQGTGPKLCQGRFRVSGEGSSPREWLDTRTGSPVVTAPVWEFRKLFHNSLRHMVSLLEMVPSKTRSWTRSFLWLPSNAGYSLVQSQQAPPGKFSPRCRLYSQN